MLATPRRIGRARPPMVLAQPTASDQLALPLAERIARMPRRAGVDGGGSAVGVLRYMRCHAHRAAVGDECGRIVGLVGTEREASLGAGSSPPRWQPSSSIRRSMTTPTRRPSPPPTL